MRSHAYQEYFWIYERNLALWLLLRKLDRYGIRGLRNIWLLAYLDDRHQYVHISNTDCGLLKMTGWGATELTVWNNVVYMIYLWFTFLSVGYLLMTFLLWEFSSSFWKQEMVDLLCSCWKYKMNNIWKLLAKITTEKGQWIQN